MRLIATVLAVGLLSACTQGYYVKHRSPISVSKHVKRLIAQQLKRSLLISCCLLLLLNIGLLPFYGFIDRQNKRMVQKI